MQLSKVQRPHVLLLLGDGIVLLLVTLFGFTSHERLDSGIIRILATFVPLMIGWALIGIHVGVFNPAWAADPHQLWRPFWAMVLAGPFAGWMRALFLGTDTAPIFVIILGGISALSLLAWRILYVVLNQRFVIQREISETI